MGTRYTLWYTISSLCKLRRNFGSLPSDVVARLKVRNILHMRGRRGGVNRGENIPIVKSLKRKTSKVHKKSPYKHLEVARKWYDLPSLLLSNVTSLNNKLHELTMTVEQYKSDIVVITEAWQIIP